MLYIRAVLLLLYGHVYDVSVTNVNNTRNYLKVYTLKTSVVNVTNARQGHEACILQYTGAQASRTRRHVRYVCGHAYNENT